MRRLHLVRHGLPAADSTRPAREWPLDPQGYDAIATLRDSGRLPAHARWFSSPEPKALETARRLTTADVEVVPDLREHERAATRWFKDREEWASLVARVFAEPDQAAYPGWEPLAVTRARVAAAVRRILAAHADADLVLVGHGTAWTALRAELTGTDPDLRAWADLLMPDVWTVTLSEDADGATARRLA